ncbi:hypothetical protein LTR74_007984 [Friedmanniomyces endolithicus]|nr:hypothetical protein LTR74_007984 [Friedmanniomyces endolithicus]
MTDWKKPEDAFPPAYHFHIAYLKHNALNTLDLEHNALNMADLPQHADAIELGNLAPNAAPQQQPQALRDLETRERIVTYREAQMANKEALYRQFQLTVESHGHWSRWSAIVLGAVAYIASWVVILRPTITAIMAVAALHDENGHSETHSVNQGTPPDPTVSMPSSTPTTAGLHRLPPELRNLIYELVLFGNDCFPHETNTDFSIFEPPKASPIPPLTQINRDIRTETLPIWYGNQKLRVASWDYQQAPRFKSWLGVYEAHLHYLKLFVLAPCLLHDTTCIWSISGPRDKISDVAFVFQGTYPPRTLGPAFDAKE